MNIIALLAPVSILLALGGLAFFAWTFKNRQYDDPQGDAARILYDHLDEGPPPANDTDGPRRKRRPR
jgi:cbb3-type cytochrome oxidase maturation protein